MKNSSLSFKSTKQLTMILVVVINFREFYQKKHLGDHYTKKVILSDLTPKWPSRLNTRFLFNHFFQESTLPWTSCIIKPVIVNLRHNWPSFEWTMIYIDHAQYASWGLKPYSFLTLFSSSSPTLMATLFRRPGAILAIEPLSLQPLWDNST